MPYKDPEAKKAWRRLNRERNDEKLKKWHADNPDAQKIYSNRSASKKKERDEIPRLVMKLFKARIEAIEVEIKSEENKDGRCRRKLRENVIKFLGGRCEWCGFDNILCLEVDHKEPIRRRTNGISTTDSASYWRKILKGEEKNAQLLCANCHALKTRLDREYGNGVTPIAFDPYEGLGI